MKKLYYFLIFITWTTAFVQIVNASHQIEFKTPTTMITTVGQLTTLQLDIKNAGTSSEKFQVTISASLPNEVEITNPNMRTQIVNPGQTISVSSSIRALTESNNVLTIKIFRDGDSSHFQPQPPIAISVKSKKLSLPEFGLAGFLQIVTIAAIIYFKARR